MAFFGSFLIPKLPFVTRGNHFGTLGVHFGDPGLPRGRQRRPLEPQVVFLSIFDDFGVPPWESLWGHVGDFFAIFWCQSGRLGCEPQLYVVKAQLILLVLVVFLFLFPGVFGSPFGVILGDFGDLWVVFP